MDEQTAKTKWCPYKAMHQATAIALMDANRRPVDLPHSTCVGSECMMWRWGSETMYLPETSGVKQAESEGWQVTQIFSGQLLMKRKSDTEGYCGLAGKP